MQRGEELYPGESLVLASEPVVSAEGSTAAKERTADLEAASASTTAAPSSSSATASSASLDAPSIKEEFSFLSESELTLAQRFQEAADNYVAARGLDECLNVAYIADLIGLDASRLSKHSKFKYVLWIILLRSLGRHMKEEDFKYRSQDEFLVNYNGVFDQEKRSEKKKLFQTANWMAVMMRMISAWKNKCLIMDVVAKLVEGWSVKYFTGVGQTKATSNRVHIFETEGNIQPSRHMQQKVFRNPVGLQQQKQHELHQQQQVLSLRQLHEQRLRMMPGAMPDAAAVLAPANRLTGVPYLPGPLSSSSIYSMPFIRGGMYQPNLYFQHNAHVPMLGPGDYYNRFYSSSVNDDIGVDNLGKRSSSLESLALSSSLEKRQKVGEEDGEAEDSVTHEAVVAGEPLRLTKYQDYRQKRPKISNEEEQKGEALDLTSSSSSSTSNLQLADAAEVQQQEESDIAAGGDRAASATRAAALDFSRIAEHARMASGSLPSFLSSIVDDAFKNKFPAPDRYRYHSEET